MKTPPAEISVSREAVLAIPCPMCGKPAGEVCIADQDPRFTRFHNARVDLAAKVEAMP